VKKLLKGIGIVVVSLLVVVGAVILGARWIYGPLGPFPGSALTGTVVEEPVEDWSSIDAIEVIQIETDPENPYSVSVWVTRAGNQIYITGDEESPWVRNIGDDPRVRIRVEGRIHECSAVRVADLETKRAFLEAFKSKYEGDLGYDPDLYDRGWDTGDFVLLRMDPRDRK
jgi:hypothetical protein